MELKYFSFQAWKVMESHGKLQLRVVRKLLHVNYCGSKDKIKCRRVMSGNTPKTRTILTIFETGS